MSVTQEPRVDATMQVAPKQAAETASEHGSVMTTTASKIAAVLRIAMGLVFLWAFLDKLFGLGYATASESAWLNGGSPTEGYLSGVDVGPFAATMNSLAGAAWADWLFMAGLLGIGAALLLGVGLRVSAAAGTVMLMLMWLAAWPLARFTEAGELTRSTNPIIEDHLIYALVLILLAAVYAGNTWGLGRRWAGVGFVRHNHWLR
ncbi:DoxX family membrane protein [Haloechinothrix sp. YIM 98757]|uniref:DoxX family membrane protein n=2 Tax=Haloechinothrix aidingensis TaxID=2752311 RepID=A0A838AEY2_9PSEU|nr:DoxX family membrane protein [Haloechinothrix aidingensis]